MTHLPQSARRRLQAQPFDEHPDAGLLTAFAEHSLDSAERDKLLAHLSACGTCREIVALALPQDAPVEEVTPAAGPSFRWPLLRWAAVAATAVIVWAAVSVLVPRTSNRDVSAPAQSAANTDTADRTAPTVRAAAHATAPAASPRASTREVARDQALTTTADQLNKNSAAAKAPVAATLSSNAVLVTNVPAPPPPPAPEPEKAAQAARVGAGAARGIAGGTAAKAPMMSAGSGPQPLVNGGPLPKDAANLDDLGKTTGAVIAGTITDPTGAVVPNVLVTVTNAQTNTSTSVRTDSSGKYRTPVTPGVYSVEATSPGWQPTKVTDLNIDRTVAQNFTLHIGASAEMVAVTGASAAIPAAAPPPVAQAERKALKEKAPAGVAGLSAAAPKTTYKAWLQPLWRVSRDGALEQSQDGKSWAQVKSAPSGVFRAVSVFGSDVWAGGEAGALYHSADAGRAWTRVPVGAKDAPVSDAIIAISISNASSITVTTSAGARWSTTDAGRTWKMLSTPR